jgi:type VI protein secretion system component VasF
MGSSAQVTPLGSYRGSSPAMDRRGWNLALGFQEVFTAVVRLRYNRQAVQDAEAFRAQMRQALRVAEQEARSRGCSSEDVTNRC